MAEAQQRAGHDAYIVTTNAEHPRGTYHAPGWDTLVNGVIPVLYGAVHFEPLRFSRDVAIYLKRTVSEFDVVHVHGLYRFPSTYAAWQGRRQRVPYIITPHGALDPYLYDKSTAGSVWLKRLYERLFDLPNLNAANAIHFTTEEERERAAFPSSPDAFVRRAKWARLGTVPPAANSRRAACTLEPWRNAGRLVLGTAALQEGIRFADSRL